MGLLIDDLIAQVLDQTRVVTNGPVLEPHEPLRVDIVPGGGTGDVPVNDALTLILGSTNALDVLKLDVEYEVWHGATQLGSGDFLRIPTRPAGTATDLLTVAFLLAPRVKFVKAGKLLPDIAIGLPQLDFTLKVILTVTSSTGQAPTTLTRTIEVPFTIAAIEIPLPIPPAVCICAEDPDFKGSTYLVMVPPGAPPSVGELVATYNSVLDALNSLSALVSLISIVVKPLQAVVDLLAQVRDPYITTTARVQDFDDYNDFDDEMTSFLMVGPTGYGVRFNDTSNPGDWDDWFTNEVKSYTMIDVLQLDKTARGQYVMGRLNILPADLIALRNTIAGLTGAAVPADATIGIGVMLVHDLTSSSVPQEMREYDNDAGEGIDDDIESALWIMG